MTQRPERKSFHADEDPQIMARLQQQSDSQITRTKIKLMHVNQRMLEALSNEIRITREARSI
jgi:hypothetical protein